MTSKPVHRAHVQMQPPAELGQRVRRFLIRQHFQDIQRFDQRLDRVGRGRVEWTSEVFHKVRIIAKTPAVSSGILPGEGMATGIPRRGIYIFVKFKRVIADEKGVQHLPGF